MALTVLKALQRFSSTLSGKVINKNRLGGSIYNSTGRVGFSVYVFLFEGTLLPEYGIGKVQLLCSASLYVFCKLLLCELLSW